MADAQITVGADASAVERAAALAKNAWRDASGAIASAVGDAARRTIGSLAEVAVAQGKVNFSAQHQSVREFEGATARLAVSMGRDLEQVRGSIEATGLSIGRRPQEVAGWASEVGRLTYNFRGAVDAQKGLTGLAAQTGRSVEDYRGLATELANVARVTGDTSSVVGVLAAQADKLGTAGGVAQFADQIEALGGTISQFSVKSAADFEKVTALAGALGKNFRDPAAAMRAQQGAIGALAADPMRWERYLGRDLMDPKTGQIPAEKIPAIMQEIVEKTKARFGRRAQRVLQMNFGNEAGAAMYNADYAAAAEAAGLAPSRKPAEAAAAYRATDAGKREVADAELAKSSRALMGSATLLGKAADGLQQFAAKNPFTSTALTSMGAAMSGVLVSSIGGGITAAVKAVVAQNSVGAAVGTARGAVAGNALGAIGIGAAALGAGLWAIDKWDEAGQERIAGQEKAGVSVNAHQLMLRKKQRESRVAALEGAGASHGQAVFVAEHERDKVGTESRAQADELAAKIARAVADAMKNAKFQVTTRADTPVEVTAQGASKMSSGDQSDGG